jgi:hypothetical protein
LRESRDKNSLHTSFVRIRIERPLFPRDVVDVVDEKEEVPLGDSLVGLRKLVEAALDPPRNGRVAKFLLVKTCR